MGCDPLEGLARIALDPQTDVALKARCFSDLAQYVFPKRKAIDVMQDSPELRVTVTHIGRNLDTGGLPVRVASDPDRALTSKLLPPSPFSSHNSY